MSGVPLPRLAQSRRRNPPAASPHAHTSIMAAQFHQVPPQLFWVIAYAHLSGRVPCERQRREFPLNQGVQDKLAAANLSNRVRPLRAGQMCKDWWETSDAALAGPYLHSLVLARPGVTHDGHLDFEGRTCMAYFQTGIYTLRICEVWRVAQDPTTFVTLCKRGCDENTSIGQLFNLKVGVACPYVDYSSLRLQRACSKQNCLASEVFAQFGVQQHDHVRMIIVVEPLADLVAARCWSTLGVLPRWRLPHGVLAVGWGQSWPPAATRMQESTAAPTLDSARA